MNEPRVEPRASQAGIEDAGFEARVGRELESIGNFAKETVNYAQRNDQTIQAILDRLSIVEHKIAALTRRMDRVT